MRKNDSTSAIANKARRDAGFKEADVTVRGDDKTLNEVLHDRKSHVPPGEVAAAAFHAFDVGEAVIASHYLHALGKAPIIAGGIAMAAAGPANMYEMEKAKLAMKDGATRDQLHAAILDRLDVPAGFRQKEMKRLDVQMDNQSASKKISDQFTFTDKALVATLQLHCDQGMHAARQMASGDTQQAFLKANPKMAERYASDAAYRNGFDAMVWARADSPATFKATTEALESRDAFYKQAHITWRV
jgi:hypothetical protein